MAKHTVLLSIIIPAYNRQEGLDYLLACLSEIICNESVENKVEIIVIDDCSVAPVKINTPVRIVLARNDENHGAPYSRHKGFLLSVGSYIHFHDSDDLLGEKWLSNIIEKLEANPDADLLLTARYDHDNSGQHYKHQKYFHKQSRNPEKVKSRLIYRNCMGPLGGVTFSRRVLEKLDFKNFSSCQDWQMYLDAIQYAKVLVSLPDTHFIFNKTGDDRISHNPRKKILGHLQLAKITAPKSIFKKNIRLFYLYTCKQHIYNKGGLILAFYKKNRFKIIMTFLVVSVYWRLT